MYVLYGYEIISRCINELNVEGHTAKWPAYVRFPIHNTL